NTIANMMAEAEALNGIFAPDEITYAWFRSKGMTDFPYPPFAAGAEARYAIPAADGARERLTFDKAMIGSCTNGGYDDLLTAALVVRAARKQGAAHAGKPFVIFPGSGGVRAQIERP